MDQPIWQCNECSRHQPVQAAFCRHCGAPRDAAAPRHALMTPGNRFPAQDLGYEPRTTPLPVTLPS